MPRSLASHCGPHLPREYCSSSNRADHALQGVPLMAAVAADSSSDLSEARHSDLLDAVLDARRPGLCLNGVSFHLNSEAAAADICYLQQLSRTQSEPSKLVAPQREQSSRQAETGMSSEVTHGRTAKCLGSQTQNHRVSPRRVHSAGYSSPTRDSPSTDTDSAQHADKKEPEATGSTDQALAHPTASPRSEAVLPLRADREHQLRR